MAGLYTAADLGELLFDRNQVFDLDFIYKDENGTAVPLCDEFDVPLYGAEMQIREAPGDGETRLYTFSSSSLVASGGAVNIFFQPGAVAGRIRCLAPDTATVLWEAGSYNSDFRIWLLSDPTFTPIYLFRYKLKVLGVTTAPDPA